MTEETDEKKPLTLAGRGKLEMRRPPAAAGQVRQSFSHGRSKTVTVEVKKKRGAAPVVAAAPAAAPARPAALAPAPAPIRKADTPGPTHDEAVDRSSGMPPKPRVILKPLTDEEKTSRTRALEGARRQSVETRARAEEEAARRAEEDARAASEREASSRREAEEAERKRHDEASRTKAADVAAARIGKDDDEDQARPAVAGATAVRPTTAEEDERVRRPGAKVEPPRRPATMRARGDDRRRGGKMTVQGALDENERVRSLASFRRQQQRNNRRDQGPASPQKVFRDVILPETITVQELASRMSERGVDVIKSLMKMGMMVTINQVIDADTAELIATEFGHRPKRVSASDVEIGLRGDEDDSDAKDPRPPVVTIMGHVDHGKTSLLDALRATDVAAGEAGGITQHIGAYQVQLKSGGKITFLDTPGHEAFTSMRARGAKVTDIVVLVVAADDGVMPQTIEAIRHAQAAEVPIIVAINKMDKPGAEPDRVRRELLQHGLVAEEMGGEVITVPVSAKTKQGLDKLEELILLQAEVLELRANANRRADGIVVEAKLDRGRGAVATVLIQRGTLRVGDVMVAGREWGRVRALINDRGLQVDEVRPGEPTEVLGLAGTPEAGDEFSVVADETRARDITAFRTAQAKSAIAATTGRSSLEQMFDKIKIGEAKTLPIIVKGDVRGSVEAIQQALEGISTDEVSVRVLHSAVGAITESDVTLAQASRALIIGFNVRANAQARDRAKRDNIDIRYYSIIYNLVDDMKASLSGMLKPALRENTLGQARIKEVFSITKVGKIAGCEVVEGVARRGARLRLLRDDVVIHEGAIDTLKHFKDDVREVRAGSECGIAIENYQDVQVGDMIEIYEVQEIARTL